MGFSDHLLVKWAVTTLFGVGLFSPLSQAADLDSRIQALTQKISYHDGPNCYNAVSVAQGFTDQITQTSSAELKFYLSLFCRENTGAPQKGDIITVASPFNGALDHAAIDLGPHWIFEKPSLAGLHGMHKIESHARYRITIPSSSFVTLLCPRNQCLRQSYTCEMTPPQAEFLKRCQNAKAYEAIAEAKTLLQELNLNPEKDISTEIRKSSEVILARAGAMSTLEPTDPCALYYLTAWTSIAWNLTHLVHEYNAKNPPPDLFPYPLDKGLEDLAQKLKPHFQAPQSLWILKEIRGSR